MNGSDCILRPPHVRQELLDRAERRAADLRQHAAQVRLRVEAIPLGLALAMSVQSRA